MLTDVAQSVQVQRRGLSVSPGRERGSELSVGGAGDDMADGVAESCGGSGRGGDGDGRGVGCLMWLCLSYRGCQEVASGNTLTTVCLLFGGLLQLRGGGGSGGGSVSLRVVSGSDVHSRGGGSAGVAPLSEVCLNPWTSWYCERVPVNQVSYPCVVTVSKAGLRFIQEPSLLATGLRGGIQEGADNVLCQ